MAEKLGRGAAPFRDPGHKLPQAGRDRIGFDHGFDGLGPIGGISLHERPGRPQCRLTCCRPLSEVRHARLSVEFHVR